MIGMLGGEGGWLIEDFVIVYDLFQGFVSSLYCGKYFNLLELIFMEFGGCNFIDVSNFSFSKIIINIFLKFVFSKM